MQLFSLEGLYVFVNGYGVPEDPLTDSNLRRYLSQVMRSVDRVDDVIPVTALYLCGGRTSRPDLSEAAAMRQWIVANAPEWRCRARLIEGSIDAQNSLRQFADMVPPGAPVLVFCEYSRRHVMRALAARLLPGRDVSVLGIAFDRASLTPSNQLVQLLRVPFEVLSLRVRLVDDLRANRRAAAVLRARRAMGS